MGFDDVRDARNINERMDVELLDPTETDGDTSQEQCERGENSRDLVPRREQNFCCELLKVMGPGLMVCLADTDGPCLITAAQSGAEFGYSLVACQLVLIPILYMAQELTVRLGVITGKGLTELIR
jgi:hypothetical protein